MSSPKLFLIQLLNIAGLGPLFGALSGACRGPRVYLWIVFGTILAGGIHDYMSGMMSIRHGGSLHCYFPSNFIQAAELLALPTTIAYPIGIVPAVLVLGLFIFKTRKDVGAHTN